MTYQTAKSFLKTNDLHAARIALTAGITACSGDARLYALMAYIDHKEGQFSRALDNLLCAVELDEDNASYWSDLWICMKKTTVIHNSRRFFNGLSRALAHDRVDHYIHVRREAVGQIKRWIEKAGTVAAYAAWASKSHVHESDDQALHNLFLTFLEFAETLDEEMEEFLTELRAHLLMVFVEASYKNDTAAMVELIAALAMHCFRHEYVFEQSQEEETAVRALTQRISWTIENNVVPGAVEVATVAMYQPLHEIPNAPHIPRIFSYEESNRFALLLKLQIHDYFEEKALRQEIPRLTAIDHNVSLAVKGQYEENPYPRWQHLSFAVTTYVSLAAQKILVAGCGTGREAISAALTNPTADIWACDLSLASLCYAMRMAKAFKVENIQFFQADLLKLDELDVRFDKIFCSGVIHHLQDPARGLEVLRRLLAVNGTINLAIYAAPARTAIAAGVRLRQQLNLPSTRDGIRRLRRAIYDLPALAPAHNIVDLHDFYFVSECRDLLFHLQEREYTLTEAAALFEHAQTKLIKVRATKEAQQQFHKRFPGASLADLDLWSAVEVEGVDICGPMYSFVLSAA